MHPLALDGTDDAWRQQFAAPLLAWYGACARALPWRSEPTPYRVWVSEIMLQQTRIAPALPYFERFVRTLPDVYALADAPPDLLQKLWEGLGYYSRARNLQSAAKLIAEHHGGQFPHTLAEALALPGIGEYTAGAILSIAYNLPLPAVDGNVLRVLARVMNDDSDITLPKTRRAWGALLARVLPPARAGDFNQALMELGALVCRPCGPPLCGECPVQGVCAARAAGGAQTLPRKPPKKARRREARTVLVAVSRRGVLLRRREARGLLAGLWEFPSAAGTLDEAQARAAAEALGLRVCSMEALPPARHVFSHIEWEMTAFALHVPEGDAPPGTVWATLGDIRETVALPSAFAAYTALLRDLLGETPLQKGQALESET